MQRKTKRPVKSTPLDDLVGATILGAAGAALIIIGGFTWHPLIILGIVVFLAAIFISRTLP